MLNQLMFVFFIQQKRLLDNDPQYPFSLACATPTSTATPTLMAAYHSAEEGRTLTFPPEGLESFVPAVAKGEWQPQR